VIVGLLHEPESAQRGEALKMRGADEAENDDTEQDPGRVPQKKRAKGGEHVVKIVQSKHAIPLIGSSAKGNFIGCLLDFTRHGNTLRLCLDVP
jgi:hypothetical protein